jgi:hypothetical protein
MDYLVEIRRPSVGSESAQSSGLYALWWLDLVPGGPSRLSGHPHVPAFELENRKVVNYCLVLERALLAFGDARQ